MSVLFGVYAQKNWEKFGRKLTHLAHVFFC